LTRVTNSRIDISSWKTGPPHYRKMGVRLRLRNVWKSRVEWFSQESYVNKIRSSRPARCVFRWSHKKHRFPIWNYGYKENMLCGRMFSISICVENGCFLVRLPIYIDKKYNELIGKTPNINFNSVEDLVRCKVLPPRNLFHLVLPYRVKGKLLFALSRSCCEIFLQAMCTHNRPEEREFEGIWVSCELRKAIEKDYLVDEREWNLAI